MLTETWTNKEHSNASIDIENYHIISRCDRADTTAGIGGGIIVYSRTNISASEVKSTSIDSSFNQYSEIKLNCDDGSEGIQVYVIYRPHKLYNDDENVRSNNQNLNNLIKSARGHSIFIGDFNYRDIDWLNNSAVNPQSKLLLETTNDAFCHNKSLFQLMYLVPYWILYPIQILCTVLMTSAILVKVTIKQLVLKLKQT